MAVGRVIILNGPTSAGKSTIARSVQSQADDFWLCLGLDAIVAAADPRLLAPESHRAVAIVDGRVQVGPDARRLVKALFAGVAAFARSGVNVVMDLIVLEAEWVDWWVAASDGIQTFWVGVAASPESIQQRERARGDRVPGMALAQSRVVHEYVYYDLVVDSNRDTPSECARKILSAIRDQHVT